MRVLVFDTETTGPRPAQDHLVQLGAILFEGEVERCAIDLLVKPDGYEIPAEAAAIHGIDTETAERFGVTHAHAASVFNAMCDRADLLVGHNLLFDVGVMEALFKRIGKCDRMPLNENRYCTAMHSTRVCKIPPTAKQRAAGFMDYKKPTLAEALAFLCGEEHVGAHSALPDVRATAKVYRELKRRRAEAEAAGGRRSRR